MEEDFPQQTQGIGQDVPHPADELLQNSEALPQPTAKTEQGAADVPQPAVKETIQIPQSGNIKDAELRELRRKTAEYENTILGKDIVIEQLQAAWDKVAGRLERQSELVGGLRLENQQLKALQAPRENLRTPEARGVGELSAEDYGQRGE